jgi:hypothetical protein
MSTGYRLQPWSDVVRPHPDIEAGKLEMSAYAADLGGVDRDDPNVPRVYRDANEFFRTTYLTRSLRRLLSDVLSVVGGGAGDRVIQLRTPFGGGKTHSLLALLHIMRSRSEIDPELVKGLPDPGAGKVVVLSGLDLDPLKPRKIDGLEIRTLWGELAYRLGGASLYGDIRAHDEEGVAPGGDTLRDLIGGKPTLILLDEVLVYVASAGGATGDNPRRRQALLFLQKLTEVVRSLPHAAMVYSLQASTHEAAGDEALLTELEKLVTRIDAKREPVSDDELTRVVQRRLFPEFGTSPNHEKAAAEVAREYAVAYRRVREAYGQTTSERRSAVAEAERFEQRVRESYPFHPALLDLMYHRWGSLPSYQRTRGALQFLATIVNALWHDARAKTPLIGPGDPPLDDEAVRGAFFSQIGQPREQYMSVINADVAGGQARARTVDDRLATDSPRFKELRVGSRVATAIMLFSFGARESEEPGVVEADLVQSLVSPELDRNVLAATLSDLRDQLLYLHHGGRRYRFEPKPNLNLLIAEEMKKVERDEVLDRVRTKLATLLRPARDAALVWPEDSGTIPDRDPVFRVVYLGPGVASMDDDELSVHVSGLVENAGTRRRDFKNAIAFALPGAATLDRCRQAARLVLALEVLESDVKANRVTVQAEQRDDLSERRKASAAELEAATDALYQKVLVPVADRQGGQPYKLEVVDLRAQLTAGRELHQRIVDGLRKYVFDSVTPARIVTLTKLGAGRQAVSCSDLVEWFFSYLDFPKLLDPTAIRNAIAAGTRDTFGYVASASIGDEGIPIPSRPELVRIDRSTPVDEIDLGADCFIVTPDMARGFLPEPVGADTDRGVPRPNVVGAPSGDSAAVTVVTEDEDGVVQSYRLSVELDAAQLFRILPALQNLADRSASVRIHLEIEAAARDGFERSWLRNAVEEHLDEAGVDL